MHRRIKMKVYICAGLVILLEMVTCSAITERDNSITSQEYSKMMLRINNIEHLLLKHFNITSNNVKVDCREQCIQDDACTSVFWNSTSDSQCLIIKDKSTKINFRSEDLYYCKDCETTFSLVSEGEDFGTIRLVNVASNQPAEASSYKSYNTTPSMAFDGNLTTQFSSENQTNKEASWLMVDLGERHLVAQIKIQVQNTLENKNRGGYFEVCLVNTFDSNVNPCNQNSRILNVNRRLRSSIEVFDADNILMGRFIVLKKLKPNKVLELVEFNAYAVIPVTSYICGKCKSVANAVCNSSETTPQCRCIDNYFPINGNALEGCRNPCAKFQSENAVCISIDSKNRKCSCTNETFYPIGADPCNGCINKCEKCNSVLNAVCKVTEETLQCKCIDSYFPINGDVINGCKDPCIGFRVRNAECSPLNSEDFSCQCKERHIPMYDGNPCYGCKIKGCTAHVGYAFYENFGCLKAHNIIAKNWHSARAECIEEGGDLFTPGHEMPVLPEQIQLNTIKNYGYWFGIRKHGSGLYERVTENDQSELQKDSSLWAWTYPTNDVGKDCVDYGSQTKLLYNENCNTIYRRSICQIYDL